MLGRLLVGKTVPDGTTSVISTSPFFPSLPQSFVIIIVREQTTTNLAEAPKMIGKKSGRTLLLYTVGTGCLIVITLFHFYGYEKTWQIWNIHTIKPYLIDSRVITAGAEAHAQGLDPLRKNPGFTQMNYPRIWYALFWLGIDQSDTIYFGITFAVLFFAGLFMLAKAIDRPTAWLMTCATFSPAVLLGLERGNTDLLMFFLLVLSVYIIDKSRVGAGMIVAFAFLLKLYPVFAVTIFLKESKKIFLTIMAVTLFACGIYAVVMLDELRLVRAATPKPSAGAYGIDVAWTDLSVHHFGGAAVGLRIASYLAVILIVAISLIYADRRTIPTSEDGEHLAFFRLGAAIFVGTFLLGGNWDYRMVFLLCCIPKLMDWRHSLSKQVRVVAITTLVFIIVSLWDGFTRRLLVHALPVFFILDLLSKWMVLFGLMYLFIYSLPRWLELRLAGNRVYRA